MAKTFNGWDQIYQLESKKFKRKSDKIILLVHWNLIINNEFKCCGLGNEKYVAQSDRKLQSELLPDGWNFSNQYNLRYLYKNESLFLLIGIELANDTFLLHLLQPDSEVMTSVIIEISNVVVGSPINSKIPNLFINYEIFLNIMQNDLVRSALKDSGHNKNVITKKEEKKEKIEKEEHMPMHMPSSFQPRPPPYYPMKPRIIHDYDNWEVINGPKWLKLDYY